MTPIKNALASEFVYQSDTSFPIWFKMSFTLSIFLLGQPQNTIKWSFQQTIFMFSNYVSQHKFSKNFTFGYAVA